MAEIDFNQVIENESERLHYVETHTKILNFICEQGKTTFREIVRLVQGSDRRVLRLLHQMVLAQEITKNGFYLQLTKEAEKTTTKVTFDECSGTGVKLSGMFANILSVMKKYYDKKPAPTFLFDQRPVTAETSVRRAAYLAHRQDIIGKRIAVIGDDDLTSLALGLTYLPKEIVVFDIDPRLLQFIDACAKEYDLPIKTVVADLTKADSNKFRGHFDVFLTDPTPQPDPFKLFTSIGLSLLKPESGIVGYISFFPSHQSISLEFQKILTDLGVIITDMIPGFTHYDFLKETYRESDLQLLNEYETHEEQMSFHENLTRVVTTKETSREISLPSSTSAML